jgi:serine/threonine-protein kinase ATR
MPPSHREKRELIRAYVRTSLQHLDAQSLLEVRDILSNPEQNGQTSELLAVIATRLDALNLSTIPSDGDKNNGSPSLIWRKSLKEVTRAIVEPDDITWMDDDETLSDAHYITRAVTDIERRCER